MRSAAGRPPELLVVDDDERLREALARALRLDGFAVRTAPDGASAVRAVAAARPDVVLLDVAMPGPDGIAVVRHLREQGVDVPVCILSARADVADRVLGLEAGADDYLVKPFAFDELKARITALLRRRPAAPPASTGRRAAGDIRLDLGARQAWRGDRELELTRREFDLLRALVERTGEVVDRETLLHTVWGHQDPSVSTNVVDVFAGYLRRKLEADGGSRVLHTVRGVGFTLDPSRG